ncbi:hypothetical protein CB1_000838009 [Camelus ferus]|nr:hypothetical protein CB1_000838009 [Camelus ferus]
MGHCDLSEENRLVIGVELDLIRVKQCLLSLSQTEANVQWVRSALTAKPHLRSSKPRGNWRRFRRKTPTRETEAGQRANVVKDHAMAQQRRVSVLPLGDEDSKSQLLNLSDTVFPTRKELREATPSDKDTIPTKAGFWRKDIKAKGTLLGPAAGRETSLQLQRPKYRGTRAALFKLPVRLHTSKTQMSRRPAQSPDVQHSSAGSAIPALRQIRTLLVSVAPR